MQAQDIIFFYNTKPRNPIKQTIAADEGSEGKRAPGCRKTKYGFNGQEGADNKINTGINCEATLCIKTKKRHKAGL